MADRWNEEREHEGRYRSRGRDQGFDAHEGREDRSFNPRAADRGRVLGERETGAGYTGPRYGAGGYTGYGDRSVNDRGYGSASYSTGRDGRDAAGGAYGAEVYQERGASRGGRPDRGGYGAQGYDRQQDDHWTFGFGHELEGPDYARGQPRREYGDAYGHRDRGLADRTRRFFGRDPEYTREAETHRGRGPQGYRRSDERINDDVHDRLTEDPHIDASGIKVTVSDGEVTLSGTVTSRYSKHHAEHIVEDLSGVKHVQNNLRVQELSASRGASTGQAAPLGENSKLSDQAAGKA